MLEILKEVIHVIMNDPVMCALFCFCLIALLICCAAGCVIMLLDSFCELNHKRKLKKKNKKEKEDIDFD